MKRLGITILLVGMAMFLTSCFLFALVPIRSAAANKAMTVPVEIGEKITTDFVNVDTSRLCSISFDVTVRSDKVHTNTSRDPQTRKEKKEYKLQYNFPVSYRVLDADENVIHFQTTKIAWNSSVRTGGGEVDGPQGGRTTVGHHFDKFKVNEPGRIQVEAEIQPDSEYEAVLESANLIVYDNVSKHGRSLVGGCAMICFAPLLIILGAILTIAGFARSPRGTGSRP